MFLKRTSETREHTGSYYAASARHQTAYPMLDGNVLYVQAYYKLKDAL